MTAIGFDAASGALVIKGCGVYQPRTLTATLTPDGNVQIVSLAERSEQYIPWGQVEDLAGNGFAVPTDAMAYLRREFSRSDTDSGSPIVSAVPMSAGMPVAISRATGQLLAARSDNKPLAFVAGLILDDVQAGFATAPMTGAVDLDDWTVVTGSSALAVGQPYFLGASGGLTTTPDLTPGLCVTRVGIAASSTTLIVAPTDPITL